MSFSDRDGFIWMDGELVPWREAKVHVLTHTLHYGMGVFEGVRAYETSTGAAVFRMQDHTRRLFDSAKIMMMDIPFDEDTVNQAQLDVLHANNLGSAYLRPMAFLGSEGMGLRADGLSVHLSISAWEWGAYLGAENMERGIRIKTSSFTRHHVNISMCKAKANGQYINSMLALREALIDGYDEALLLDNEGYVAEGSGENFFIVRDGVIYTPRITRDEVYICDEAFFSGTAAEVTPIRELDNRPIGNGGRGPITEKLQSNPIPPPLQMHKLK